MLAISTTKSLRRTRRLTDANTTFTWRWSRRSKVIEYIQHPNWSSLCTTPSSNAISPSESGAHRQRLRGLYANAASANALSNHEEPNILAFLFFFHFLSKKKILLSGPAHLVDLPGAPLHVGLHVYHTACLQKFHIFWHSGGRAGQRQLVNTWVSAGYEGLLLAFLSAPWNIWQGISLCGHLRPVMKRALRTPNVMVSNDYPLRGWVGGGVHKATRLQDKRVKGHFD